MLSPVLIERLELRRLEIPLREPFVTSGSATAVRDVLLVRVIGDGTEGWGECVAQNEPTYTGEYTAGAEAVIGSYLAPPLVGRATSVDDLASRWARVVGHPMAKAALECAVLDAQLRAEDLCLADWLGGVRHSVPAGASLGMPVGVDELVDAAEAYADAGYRRIKIKIAPGWDLEPVSAVRDRLGSQFPVQVDANGAYTSEDWSVLTGLDRMGLEMIEQPFPAEDLLAHSWLAALLDTPVCLDESLTGHDMTLLALELGACSVVNLKPGRVGGLVEAKRIHDLCADRGVPLWCGGMLETGIGRAAAVALASLPGFSLPGDLSASDRYFMRDIISEPFELVDGDLRVPRGAGLGVVVDHDYLGSLTTSLETITA